MNYSSFPEQVDSFIRKYPIQASDRNKVIEYQQLKLKTGRTDTENNRLNQLAQELSYAFIDPEEWNKFQDALINTQRFFLEETVEFLEQKQGETVSFIEQKQIEFQDEIDKFRYEDVYNPSASYSKNNTVSFQGESYIARQSSQGIPPNPLANTQYWAKIAQRGAKGDRGEAGTGLRYKGSYNPSIQYIQDDAVQFGGQMYACLQDNIGNEPNPNQDTVYWSLAVTRGQSTGTREFKNIVHVVDTRNNIPIGISQFNRSTDILHVIQNQTPLSENEHYTINPNGNSIDRISGMWDGTEEAIFFEFRVIKNYLIDPTYGDGNMIQDGTVGREKLKLDVVEDIDSAHDKIGILKEDVDEHKAQTETEVMNLENNKMNRGESINVGQIDKNSGKIDQTYMTDEFLQQMTGNTPINAVPARDSITRARLARGAITPDVLSFTEKPNNLFNKFDVLRGFSISSGNLVANVDYAASEFIYIKASQTYTCANIFRSTFYDEAQNFISSSTAQSFTTPSNAFFVRFTVVITQVNNAQVNEGITLLAYDEPKYVLKSSNKFPMDIIPSVKSIKNEAFDLKSVEPPSMTIFEPSKNIFNSKHVLVDKIINSNGDIVDNTSYVTSADFIPVKKGSTYSKSTGASLIVARYDANKNLINRSSFSADVATFTTTTATEFLRVSVTKTSQNIMMINEGNTLLPFEPYQFVMKSSEKFPIKLDEELAPSSGGGGTSIDKTSQNKDYFILEPSFNNIYTSPIIESRASGTDGHLENVTLNDIYDLFDQLLAQYPTYITRELLGDDDNGNPIYKYEFKPELPRPSAGESITSTKFIKMVITAGVHGVEKTGVWLTYLAMKNVCENWKNDGLLEALRWNVHFVVIPVVCPWSYINRTRTNHRGVDINRNFPAEWREGTVGSETYGGTAPLSEKESQYVNVVLNANTDAVYVCDFHNYFTTNGEPKNFIWMAASSKYDMGLGRYLISKMSRKWQKEQSFLSNDTQLYGYTSYSPPGSVATQALSLGIDATTFEVCRQFEMEPNFVPYSSIALTLGNEAFVNYLAVVLRNTKSR